MPTPDNLDDSHEKAKKKISSDNIDEIEEGLRELQIDKMEDGSFVELVEIEEGYKFNTQNSTQTLPSQETTQNVISDSYTTSMYLGNMLDYKFSKENKTRIAENTT